MQPSDEFLPTTKFKMIRNFFLKHYWDSKVDVFEERPTDNKQSGKIILYKITLANIQTIIILKIQNNLSMIFLNNVRIKFKSTTPVVIKCGFSIENLQLASLEDGKPILNVRYWTNGQIKQRFFKIIWFLL